MFKKKLFKTLMTTAALCIGAAANVAQADDIKTHQLKVLGTWSSLSQYKNYEEPFWTKTLPGATDGKISGQIVSVSVMGLKGYETLNLLQNGVFDMGNMVVAYVTGATPAMEGIDLAGVATDMGTSQKLAATYRDVINASLASQNLTMLAHYPFGRQFVFCKEEFGNLADLKGRKVRTSSATHADFLTGIGATTVSIPFGEVVPAIQNGVVDCAVTGAIPAYDAKWHEVINYVSAVPLNMGMSGLYGNKAKWDSMDEASRTALEGQIRAWEADTWTRYIKEESEGLSCLTGDAANCSKGEPVGMKLVEITEADKQAVGEVLHSHVFPGWLERCGDVDCKTPWNESVGTAAGISIK